MKHRISLSAVNIPEETYPMMEKALRSGIIGGESEYVERFEQAICAYTGAVYCLAVSNGTIADAVMVAAMKEAYGIKRVWVPALTFIAQPNSVRYNGLEVRFLDVEKDWLLPRGFIVDVDEMVFATDLMGRTFPRIGNWSIEDACEAFGSRNKNSVMAGCVGRMGSFSFFPSHTISTGEGGAIVTDDKELYDLCHAIRIHGSVTADPMEKFHFPVFGFNARMTTMQAILGIALMGHVEEYVTRRHEVFLEMNRLLGGFPVDDGEYIVPHAFPVKFQSEELRDQAMRTLLADGIECRKFFSCIPMEEPKYKEENSYPMAHEIASTHLYVPCHQNLSDEDVEQLVKAVEALEGRAR